MNTGLPPKNNNNVSGNVGRAASGTTLCRDAARADHRWALAKGFALIGLSIGVLAFNAPELWPHLFAPLD
jgi:hypothetical protein